jgi:predicted nuclease of predicted toxin-antitoxin system
MAWVDITTAVQLDSPTKKEIAQVVDARRRGVQPRFYTDENFPMRAVQLLRKMRARVSTAQEAGLTRHPDENHAAYALRRGYVLLTCDRDYLNERKFPLIHCPTIVVFDFGAGSESEMLQAFTAIKAMFGSAEFFDKWIKIDAKRTCWTEYARFLNGTTSKSRFRVFQRRLQEWV